MTNDEARQWLEDNEAELSFEHAPEGTVCILEARGRKASVLLGQRQSLDDISRQLVEKALTLP